MVAVKSVKRRTKDGLALETQKKATAVAEDPARACRSRSKEAAKRRGSGEDK
jgi:hypothetical protein